MADYQPLQAVARWRHHLIQKAIERGIREAHPQDAFVHAYTSAWIAYHGGSYASKVAMDANEWQSDLRGAQTPVDLNMDLWNNREGRRIGDSLRMIAPAYIDHAITNAVHAAVLDGTLIVAPDADARKFTGPPYFQPDEGTVPVLVPPSFRVPWAVADSYRSVARVFVGAGRRPIETPLALDLDGDGVETTAPSLDGAYFDHGNDGFHESTGWIAPDDGLLARDLNGNGFIDGGAELLGSGTRLRSGALAIDGFHALADLDANADGRVSAADAAWSTLRVWRDANGDGVSSPAELSVLDAIGIASLGATGAASTYVDASGNAHRLAGSYTRTDGGIRAMTDVWFQVDPTASMISGAVAVPPDVAALPIAEGFGLARDLHQAMALDGSGSLRAKVAAFSAETDAARRGVIVDEILELWTDSANVAPWSRGPNFDAKKLAVLEKFAGFPFFGDGGANPGAGEPTELLNDAYRTLHEAVQGQLMTQTHARDEYNAVVLYYDAEARQARLDWSGAAANLRSAITADAAAGEARLSAFARAMAGIGVHDLGYWGFREEMTGADARLGWLFDAAGRPEIAGTVSADTLVGDGLANALRGGDGNDVLEGRAGSDVLHGQIGDDVLKGGNGRDLLAGGAGADTLWGDHDDDVMDGGLGNDILRGGEGNDTYLFARGGGADTVDDYDPFNPGNVDTLWFGRDVRPSDVTVSPRSNADLTLKIGGTADQIRVLGGLGDWGDASALEQVRFADGAVWTLDDLKQKSLIGTSLGETIRGFESRPNTIIGNGGNDVIYDGWFADTIHGGSGNDTIYNGDGADSVTGGTGADTLTGGRGNDVYKYARGDGADVIADTDATAGNVDTLELAKGIQTYDVQVSPRTGNDLVLKLGTSDQVRISGGLHDGSDQGLVERVKFLQNGAVWTLPTIFQKALTGTAAGETIRGMLYRANTVRGIGGDDLLYDGTLSDTIEGGDGNDTLWSGDGNDVLDGGAGNDALNSGRGNDTFKFDRGYGQDRVDDNDATAGNLDTVAFGPTVLPLHLILQRQGNDMKVGIHGTSDAITISGWYFGANRHTEVLRAGDGRELRSTQVDALIQAMAAFGASSGLSWDQAIVQQPQSVQTILAAYWTQP